MKEFLGYVNVDSGTVWVGDPCYVIGNDSIHGNITRDKYFELVGLDSGEWEKKPTVEPFGEGMGMEVKTSWGDGTYPVYAEMSKHGYVKRLIIDFEPEDPDDIEEVQRWDV